MVTTSKTTDGRYPFSPPPPQTGPATEVPENNKETTEYPPQLPEDIDVIKEFIQHDKNDDYIPLMSAIALKKNALFPN